MDRVSLVRRWGVALIVLAFGVVLVNCGRKKSSSRPGPCSPEITKVSPPSGDVAGGEQVTITTLCFQDDFAMDLPEVFFGSTPAMSIMATGTSSVTVTSPPHPAAEAVDVTVQATGVLETATLANGFAYTDNPPPPNCTVDNVNPSQGFRDVANTVILDGMDFPGPLDPVPTVEFGVGSFGTNVVQLSTTQLQVDTPIVATAGTVDAIVTPVTGPSCTGSNLYTFLDPLPPACGVADVNPNQGFRDVANTVILDGMDFPGPLDPVPTVEFGLGNFGTNVVQLSTTQLQVDTPIVATAGTVDVIVTPVAAPPCTGSGLYTFLNPPLACNISGIDPTFGPEFGGNLITISGSGFTPSSQVTMGGVPASAAVIDPMTIEATAPPGTGTADMVVDIGGGTTCSLPGAYEYMSCGGPSCSILSVNPALGGVGEIVTIQGSLFEAGALVFFGTEQAPLFSQNPPDEIVVTAPPPAGGPLVADVLVINPSGICCTMVGGFTYIACTIDTISPVTGGTAGGDTVTIIGSGFDPVVEILFDGIPADPATIWVDLGGTQISCESPPSPTEGVKGVEVRNVASGTACLVTCGFAYIAPGGGGCVLTGISPTAGPTIGGQTVQINGAGFLPNTCVFFGVYPATVIFLTSNTINVASPTVPNPGTVDVTVAPEGDNPCFRPGAYTYN